MLANNANTRLHSSLLPVSVSLQWMGTRLHSRLEEGGHERREGMRGGRAQEEGGRERREGVRGGRAREEGGCERREGIVMCL